MMTRKLLAAALMAPAMTLAMNADGASLLQDLIVSQTGMPGIFNIELNDDDQAVYQPGAISQIAPVFVNAPILNNFGVPTGGTVPVQGVQTGDAFFGLVDFPTIDLVGFGTGINLPGFELTGTYGLFVTSISGGEANVIGYLDLWEDGNEDADFATSTGFNDGDFLGRVNLAGTVDSGLPILPSTAAGVVPTGVELPGSNVDLIGALDIGAGGALTDPSFITQIGPISFSFNLEGPETGFDFGSNGGVNFVANVVPSPAAAGVALFGLLGLGLTRKHRTA
jgi:hypothetical protein